MEVVDGVATFALSAGETKTARHLPTGVSYTVVEDAADEDSDADGADDAESADAESTDAESTGAGYTTTWRNDTGTIADGQTAEAVCTNAYPSPSKPTDGTDDTGGTSDSPADKTVKPAQASKALPQTGDATSSMAAAGILAACAAIAAGIALRRRA
jgi:LPXTG-motif cell wall-anchored protein